MKSTITCFFYVLSVTISASAESTFESELKVHAEIKDKALLAATDPIYRRYRTSLEQLLRQATQANDLEAAVKIKAAISAIPIAATLGKSLPKTAADLKEFLHGTTWNISNGSPTEPVAFTYTFNKNGTLKHSNGKTGALECLGPRSMKFWNYDPAEFNEDFTQFRAQGAHTVYYGTLKPKP